MLELQQRNAVIDVCGDEPEPSGQCTVFEIKLKQTQGGMIACGPEHPEGTARDTDGFSSVKSQQPLHPEKEKTKQNNEISKAGYFIRKYMPVVSCDWLLSLALCFQSYPCCVMCVCFGPLYDWMIVHCIQMPCFYYLTFYLAFHVGV